MSNSIRSAPARSTRLLAVVAAPLILAGCASRDVGADNATELHPCTLLPSEVVAPVLGADVLTGQYSTKGDAQECTWTEGSGVLVIAQVRPDVARLESARRALEIMQRDEAEELPGMGDEAFYVGGTAGPLTAATVGARKGSTATRVQVMAEGGDAETMRSQAVEITRLLLLKL